MNKSNHPHSIAFRVVLALLLTAFLSVACKEDADSGPNVSFPEKVLLEGHAGDVLTLDVNTPDVYWELSSDQPVWCRLTCGKQTNMASVVGNSSAQVKVLISDDNETYGLSSTANLSLTMSGRTQVIATVTRGKASTTVSLHRDGTLIPEGGTLTIGSDGTAQFTLTTNFGTPELEHADWFDVTLEQGVYRLQLNEGHSLKYAIPASEGYIRFHKAGSEEKHSYQVAFAGMDSLTTTITGYSYTVEGTNLSYTMSPFNWNVSADGLTMTANRPNGDIVQVKKRMEVSVDALNDNIVFAQWTDGSLRELTGGEFFHVSQDMSHVAITVDALPAATTKREATLYAFSSARWQQVAGCSQQDELNSNVIFSFVQQAEGNGFEIEYYDWSTYEMGSVDVQTETSADMLAAVRLLTGSADNVYSADMTPIPVNQYTNCKALTVMALLAQDEWDTGRSVRTYALFNLTDGTELTTDKSYSIDPGLDISGHWQFDMAYPATLHDPLLLVIYGDEAHTTVVKALIMKN